MLRYTLFLLVAVLTACSPRLAPEAPADQPLSFTILQINDVYEISPLEGGKVAGLARVATVLRELEAENPNTIAVIAGDFLSPSFAGNLRLDNGEKIAGLQMVETLNALGMDYATFGNHEFDLSDPDLLVQRIDDSEFRYMSCNARRRQAGAMRPFTQDGQPIPDYAIHTFSYPDGRTLEVALVGVVLPFNQIDYVAYLPVEESFRSAVAAARAEAPVVVGLTHLAVDEDEALAAAVPGLPLFMGGHDHEHMSRYVGRTAITKADANAKTVYVHRCTYYPEAGITQVNSELMYINDAIASEPATQAVVEKWGAIVAERIAAQGYDPNQMLMEAKTPLEGTEAAVRNYQTSYGRLTCQAFEYAYPGADVYLFNGGSLRLDDNLLGQITSYDVLRSFPYGGPIVRMDMSGQSLQQLLQTGATTNRGEGGYLQRIHAEPNGSAWRVRGEPIDPGKTYHVVLPEFVASGREANLGFLGELTYEKKEEFPHDGQAINNDIRDIVMAYMASLGVWE
jgi:5'-nucleotidase